MFDTSHSVLGTEHRTLYSVEVSHTVKGAASAFLILTLWVATKEPGMNGMKKAAAVALERAKVFYVQRAKPTDPKLPAVTFDVVNVREQQKTVSVEL